MRERKEKAIKYARTHTVFQMEATECGAAALAMILEYYGKYVPLERLRVEVDVSRDGSKAGNIMRAGTSFGMEVHGYRKELERLLELQPPCIIHWNFNHFVVYEGIKNGKVYLNDPAVGHRTLTMEEFDNGYTGIVITMKPTENFQKEKRTDFFLKLVMEKMKGQQREMLAIILIGILLIFPNYFLAMFSKVFVDQIFVPENYSNIALFAALVLLNLCFQVFYKSLHYKVLLKLQNKVSLISAQKFINHLFRLPIGFFEQRYDGDLSNRISNNDMVCEFLCGDFLDIAVSIFESLFYSIILFIYSPILLGIVLLGLLIDLVLIMFSSRKLKEISMKLNQDSGKMIGVLLAGLSIMDSIKVSGEENSFLSRLLGNYAQSCDSEQKMKRTQQILNAFPEAIMTVLKILVLLVGSLLVMEGSMTVGMLVAFTSLLVCLLTPVNRLMNFVYAIQMIKTNIHRVNDIMGYAEEEKYQKPAELEKLYKLQGNISLENLSFGYSRRGEAVIHDISFQIRQGESIALVGGSGSGKSTIGKLLCNLYTPWSGKIFIDGKDLKDIPNEVLNLSLADVSQNISIFRGSVQENITLWNKGISEEDVIRAAKDACIHEVITAKPNAYSYVVSENGLCFSGGERQRLEIARALALNPSILIMDEATSALDAITEEQILQNIKRRGCTSVIIAHRLSAIRNCDRIIVLKNGKIAESGTHKELMEKGAIYKELIQLN